MPEDVLKVDADEDGVGGDDVDRLRYLVATKARIVAQRKLRGYDCAAAQARPGNGVRLLTETQSSSRIFRSMIHEAIQGNECAQIAAVSCPIQATRTPRSA